MALSPKNARNPYDPTTPLAAAYARINRIEFVRDTKEGRLVLGVYASSAAFAAGAPPVSQLGFRLGDEVPRSAPSAEPAKFPSFEELTADPEFAAAFATLTSVLYRKVRVSPDFADASDV